MIPKEWKRVPLVKVAEVRTGLAKGKQPRKDPVEIPYLRVANVQDGYIDLSEIKLIAVEKSLVTKYLLEVGDVLMTEGGDFDKLGRGDVWNGQINPCIHQNHVFCVRPNADIILPFFLASLSGSSYGKLYFLSCAKRSTNLASINSTQLKEFPVLLPPLPEQKKIARILSTWDKAIETVDKLIENSQQQKKALMQQLLTGKKRLPGFSGEWKKVRLGEVCKFSGGAGFKEDYQGNSNGDYPFIKVSDMNLLGNEKYITRSTNWISEDTRKIIGAKAFPKNSIVFAKVGAALLLNRRRILTRDTLIDNNMMAAACSKNAHHEFIYQLLLRIDFAKYVQEGAVPSINQSTLNAIKVHMPPLNEQVEIAKVLNGMEQLVASCEQQKMNISQQKQALMQQLLTGKRRVPVN